MTAMDCREVRLHVLEYGRGRLRPELQTAVAAHLATCADCMRTDAVERALTEVLERQLPQHPASLALKRRLAARWPVPAPKPRLGRWRRSWRLLVPALAVAVLLLSVSPVLWRQWADGPASSMVAEAVNDHLRVVQSARGFDVEGGGIHRVKPWFTGKLDFAPVVAFEGDDEFALRGGSLGWFLDRQAAVLGYGYRQHSISLLVFRAPGLPWPAGAPDPARVYATASRGFNVLMWRNGDLGYALVSDAEPAVLHALARRLGSRG
jgi:anti-sigma factor RsiW